MVKRNNKSYTIQEFRTLIDKEPRPEYRACFTLLMLTGMRIGEALPLRRKDIITAIKERFAVVTTITLKRKGHPQKEVPINLTPLHNHKLWDDHIAPHLAKYDNDPDAKLFRFSRENAYYRAKRCGFQTIHNLRRSYINHIADKGGSEFDVVSLLNLASPKVIHDNYISRFKINQLKKHLKNSGA